MFRTSWSGFGLVGHVSNLGNQLENVKKQEETRMLEMTIGTLERENVARQNQTDTFDLRNLERNLFRNPFF